MDAAETLGKDVGLKSACEAMGVARATLSLSAAIHLSVTNTSYDRMYP